MEINSNYEDALKELKAIVQQIQNNEISIDDLAEKVKRASALVQFCKEKLRSTEEEVKGLFQ